MIKNVTFLDNFFYCLMTKEKLKFIILFRGDAMRKFIDTNRKVKDITIGNILVMALLCIVIIFIFNNMHVIGQMIGSFIDAIMPVIYGIIFAFIFNVPMTFFERHLPKKNGKENKLLAAICSLAAILAIVLFIVLVIVPQLFENISTFMTDFPNIIAEVERMLQEVLSYFGVATENITLIVDKINEMTTSLLSGLEAIFPYAKDIVVNFISSIANIGIGIVVAVYLIISKEKVLHQCKTVCQVLIPTKSYSKLIQIYHLVIRVFHDFVSGQLTEAFILGVLCYFGCLILRIPYASSCGLIIGCTNIIPYFGPFIGIVVCAIIIFFVSPVQAVIFVIFGIALQQFEANFIYPHVVGTSIGLSPLFTLVTITVSGHLFGIAGMILGLPIVSIFYELFHNYIVSKKLAMESEEQ